MKMLMSLTPTIQPGAFVEPAGAQLRSIADDDALAGLWEEVHQCFSYPKADGWRIQIHKIGNDVFLFSRSGKDWTAEFPSVVTMIRERVKDNVILDTELVGFDDYGSHVEPSKLLIAPQYHCYLLDALYLHEQTIVDLPTKERVARIWEYLQDALYGTFTLAEYKLIESESDLTRIYHQCRARQKEGFDGMIIKPLDTPYFTDVFKAKPEETIDAVVVGAELNKFGEFKTLLLAVPSHKRNSWIPITKVAKKSTDWNAVWSACEPHLCKHRPSNVEEPPRRPSMWLTPAVVVTINTTSVGPGTGYLVHAFSARDCVLREDKSPKEATSFEQLLQMAHLEEQQITQQQASLVPIK